MNNNSYFIPRSEGDLQRYVDEKRSEGRHLEFKSGLGFEGDWKAAVDKISKEVSAFANAGGGVVVIGVSEDESVGSASVACAVDGINNPKRNAEWIEKPLLERVSPPVPGIAIDDIHLGSNHAIVIHVPQSFSGPHQAYDYRYYARRNFRIDPMEHFEIDDVRSRKDRKRLSFVPIIRPCGTHAIEFVSKNCGSEPVFNIRYSLPEKVMVHSAMNADNIKAARFGQFSGSISSLNPGIQLNHWLGFDVEIYSMDELNDAISIAVSYEDKLKIQYSDYYIFSAQDFGASMNIKSDSEKVTSSLIKVEKHLEGIKWEIEKFSKNNVGENNG